MFNWVLAAVFLGSQFVGERNLLERLLGGQLSLTRRVWTQLNTLWIGNFTLVGALNLVVASNTGSLLGVLQAVFKHRLHGRIDVTDDPHSCPTSRARDSGKRTGGGS